MNQGSAPSALQDYLRVIRQHRTLVLAVVALFLAAAVVISSQQDERYQAEAALAMQEPASELDGLGIFAGARVLPEARAAQGARLVTGPEVAKEVREAGNVDLEAVDASVAAAAEAKSNFVVIQAEANDPVAAARVANAYADATHRVLRADFREEVRRLIRVSQREFRSLRRSQQQGVRIAQQERFARLRTLERLGDPVVLAREATPQASPIEPKPIRNSLLALVAGLTVGLVLAFGRDALDRRVRSAEEASRLANLPVIGYVRNRAMGHLYTDADKRDDERAADAEAFRILRRNLDYLSPDERPRSVLVTSPLPEEGKSTVAASLAAAAARNGERVLLVGGDLRRPVLGERLGIRSAPGLVEFLTGHAEPQDIVQTVAIAHPEDAQSNGHGSITMAVVTSGEQVTEPAALLRSQRFRQFLEQVRDVYDLVVLDSAPLLPVVDALELASMVDAIVLCVRSGRTRRDDIAAARDLIDKLEPAKAIVFTGITRDSTSAYGYAYQSYAYG